MLYICHTRSGCLVYLSSVILSECNTVYTASI